MAQQGTPAQNTTQQGPEVKKWGRGKCRAPWNDVLLLIIKQPSSLDLRWNGLVRFLLLAKNHDVQQSHLTENK